MKLDERIANGLGVLRSSALCIGYTLLHTSQNVIVIGNYQDPRLDHLKYNRVKGRKEQKEILIRRNRKLAGASSKRQE